MSSDLIEPARRGMCGMIFVLAACELPGGSAAISPCDADGSCPAGRLCVAQMCVPEPSTCAEAVTAGEAHTCAIRDDHTAWCWGRNHVGQLGDGTTEDRTSPVEVLSLTKFAAIATATEHTCALADDHTVWCWGSSDSGQLGEAVSALTPVRVADLGDVVAIAVGNASSCAIIGDGTVKCWGENSEGQLGNGNMVPRRTPGTVPMLRNVQEIAIGQATACAIDVGGTLACWGSSSGGQLGGSSPRLLPTPMMPDVPVAHVALGQDFWCAVTAAGDVYCAGNNAFGQLGVPAGTVTTPVRVPLPVRAAAITAGDRFACATELRDDRHDRPRVWCWGQDSNSQLADGIELDHSTPAVTRYAGVIATAGGGRHLCALSETGGITCSGYNSNGQLGDGERTTQGAPPPAIAEIAGAAWIAAGASHTCAVVGDGVLCWGRNHVGQLGDGTVIDRSRPVRVIGVKGAIAVSVGEAHSCALVGDGTAMCWGQNSSGQLGGDTHELSSALPDPVLDSDGSVLSSITQLVAGGGHTCALIGAGDVKCWGNNVNGQVGVVVQTCVDCRNPLAVALAPGVRELALGENHSCALNADRTVMCWGGSNLGERGDGTLDATSTPTLVGVAPNILMNVEHIATYHDFTCAITSGGDATCWGGGNNGEMGDGTYQDRRAPGPPIGLSGVTSIAAGGVHVCAITASGLACWGASDTGQGGPLGRGGYGNSNVPVPVSLGGATAIALTAGAGHTCALLADHTVTCWGDGRVGQLGNGVLDRRTRVAPRLPCL